MSQQLISVVVPSRDRPHALGRCLDALARQTVASQLEVIVVDDGSKEATAVSSVVGRHPNARLVRRSGDGPAAARNAGARAARGSFLCFTDDDCAPEKDWAERLAVALQRGADAAGGETIPGGGALSEASEIVARALIRPVRPGGNDVTFVPSNNLACSRALFETSPFDESYRRAAGEDREWCARMIAAGHTLRLVPSARVVHHQELTFGRFLRQQARYGEGAFHFHRRSNVPRSLESWAFYPALLRRAFRRSFRVGMLVCLAQGATAVGFTRGWTAHRRQRHSVAAGTALPHSSRGDELQSREEQRRRT